MSRLKENATVVHLVAETNKAIPSESYENIMSLHMSSIILLLADISKSLAAIADKEDK